MGRSFLRSRDLPDTNHVASNVFSFSYKRFRLLPWHAKRCPPCWSGHSSSRGERVLCWGNSCPGRRLICCVVLLSRAQRGLPNDGRESWCNCPQGPALLFREGRQGVRTPYSSCKQCSAVPTSLALGRGHMPPDVSVPWHEQPVPGKGCHQRVDRARVTVRTAWSCLYQGQCQ